MSGRGILRFFLSLIAVWGVLQFLAWPRLQPTYSGAVTRCADASLGLIELGERVTHLRAEGSFIHVFSDLREDADPATTFDANVLHFYLVLFASVIIAFPSLTLRRRAVIFSASMAGLFLFHIAAVLINVEHVYAVELAKVSQRNYTDAERAFWAWLQSTVNSFAVEVVPAAALVLLVVIQGGFGIRMTAALSGGTPAAPPERSPRRSPRTFAAAGLAAVVLLAPLLWRHHGKVRARQAERECLLGYRALSADGLTQASDLFQAALSRNPRFAEAHEGLGQTLMRQVRLPEAAAEFRAAIEQRPDDPSSHMHLGSALFAMSDFAGAAVEFEASVKLRPDQREALFNLAMAQRRMGRRDEAEANLRRVIEVSPDYAAALLELSASMIASNRACGAIAYLRRLVELEPSSSRGELARQTIEDLKGKCGES